jgi:hypothetical protein
MRARKPPNRSRASSQRAYRARYDQGRVRPHIEFEFGPVAAMLVRKGFIRPCDRDSLAAVASGVEQFLEELLRYE